MGGREEIGENRAVEPGGADVRGLVVENGKAIVEVKDGAGGARGGLVAVALVLAGDDLPLAGDALAGEDARVGGGEALGEAVLEDDVVHAVAEGGDEFFVPPRILHGDHEGVGKLDTVPGAAGAAGDGAGVGVFHGGGGSGGDGDGARGEGERGVALVVGRVVAEGDVVTAPEIVRAIFGGGVGERDVAFIDEDFGAVVFRAVDLAGLAEAGEAVEAPFAEIEFVGGSQAEHIVFELGALGFPRALHVILAGAGIGDGAAGGAKGIREREIGIGAEGDVIALGVPAGGEGIGVVVEVGELDGGLFGDALLDGDLVIGVVLEEVGAGAVERVVVGHIRGLEEGRAGAGGKADTLELVAEIEEGAVVFVERETVVGAEGGEAARGIGGGDEAVLHHGALGAPEGDLVTGVPRPGGVALEPAALKGAADKGVFEWPIRDGTRPAAGVFEIPVAPALAVAAEAHEAEAELLGDQDAIEIEFVALLGPRAELGFGDGAIAQEISAFGGEGDEAAGAAEAEEDGVGATGDFDALNVVVVLRGGGFDEVDGVAGSDTADAKIAGGAVGFARGGRIEAGVGILKLALDVGRVGEHFGEVVRCDVGEKLGREDGDGSGGVFERRVEAAAGGGVGGLVADVLLGADFEGGEDGGGIAFGRSGGAGGGRGRWELSGRERRAEGGGEDGEEPSRGGVRERTSECVEVHGKEATYFHAWATKRRRGVTNQLNPAQTQFPGKSSPLSVKRPVSEDRPESEKLRSDT